MQTIKTLGLFITLGASLLACAEATDIASDEAPPASPEVTVSSASLQIEQAERILDRRGDVEEAARILAEVRRGSGMSREEESAATIAQSRVHEARGETEASVAIVEDALRQSSEWPREARSKLRQRLEQLLVDEEHKPSYLVQPHKPDPPFSHALVPYFPKNEEGTVMMRLFLIGGDSATSDRLGTFDIGRAMRTEAEKACPLCDHDISLSRSVSGSNWVVIPESTEDFASSMVVFYYDLEHNRIPDRYGDLLPIPLETVKAELALGKSFTVAKERPGAPPILLIAAPRTHLIAEAEEKVSQLDHLPTALEELDVSTKLRSDEIQAIMRASWMPHIRACYETLLKRAPQASGRFSTFFSIGADGRVSDVEPSTDDRPLQDGAFLDCIVKAAQEVTFPPTDGTTTVRYPVVVTPD